MAWLLAAGLVLAWGPLLLVALLSYEESNYQKHPLSHWQNVEGFEKSVYGKRMNELTKNTKTLKKEHKNEQ